MSDDNIDFASDLAEREREAAAKYRKPVTPRTGKCASCGEPLQNPAAFVCDSDCQEDLSRRTAAAHRSGAVGIATG